ncbi:MAG: hypothetical protein ACSLFM_08630 [Tepidiformaceae bacterium]
MSVQDLVDLVEPPTEVQVDRTWSVASDVLQVSFAPDYRSVVEVYGFGFFESGTTLYDPRRDTFGLNVGDLLEFLADPELRGEALPLPPHPGPGARLLPVTSNGSGGHLMSVVVDGVQDESVFWLADLDDDEFIEVAGPFSSLLVRLVQHTPGIDEIWHITGPFRPW